jgi:hypothetical protein
VSFQSLLSAFALQKETYSAVLCCVLFSGWSILPSDVPTHAVFFIRKIHKFGFYDNIYRSKLKDDLLAYKEHKIHRHLHSFITAGVYATSSRLRRPQHRYRPLLLCRTAPWRPRPPPQRSSSPASS